MSDNSSITTINGTDLVLLVETTVTGEWQPIAHATSHQLQITRATREVSSKSTGDWMLSAYGKASWSGSADALVSFSAGIMGYEQLLDMQIGRELIKVVSVLNNDIETGTDNPLLATKDDYKPTSLSAVDNPFVDGSAYYEGLAVITDISKTSGDGATVTFTMSFAGASILTKKTVGTAS